MSFRRGLDVCERASERESESALVLEFIKHSTLASLASPHKLLGDVCVHLLPEKAEARRVNQPSLGSDSSGNTGLLGPSAWRSSCLCVRHSEDYLPRCCPILHRDWSECVDFMLCSGMALTVLLTARQIIFLYTPSDIVSIATALHIVHV